MEKQLDTCNIFNLTPLLNSTSTNKYPLKREDAVKIIIDHEDKNDIYVSTTGNDSNNGAEQSPVKTIAKAFEMVNGTSEDPGIIYVDVGTYSPSLTGEIFPIIAISYNYLFR